MPTLSRLRVRLDAPFAFIYIIAMLAVMLPAFVPPAQARPHCLRDGALITGTLEEVSHTSRAGARFASLEITLDDSLCVHVDGRSGDRHALRSVRRVQVVPAEGGLDIDGLIGHRVSVRGVFGEPSTDWHTGDAIIFNAEVVAVDDRARQADYERDKYYDGRNQEHSSYEYDRDDADYDRRSPYSATPYVAHGGSLKDDDGFAQDDDQHYGYKHNRYANQGYRTVQGGRHYDVQQLHRRVKRFVAEHYLSSAAMDPDMIEQIYSDRIEYYGKRNLPIARVIREKDNYYRRWPDRNFQLVPGTLRISERPRNAGIYDVVFEYTFHVAGNRGVSRGRGMGLLTFDLNIEEGRIIREDGRVVQRF